eukprot:1335197-Rhodomonas_salina.1
MDLVQTASPGSLMVIVISKIELLSNAGGLEDFITKLKQSVRDATHRVINDLDTEIRELEDSVAKKMTTEWKNLRVQRKSTLRELDSGTLVTTYNA